MTIQMKDRIPEHEFLSINEEGEVVPISTKKLSQGKVVIVGVPGAFTPKCTNTHLPSFLEHRDEFKRRGIGLAVCAVNDHWVCHAWLKSLDARDFSALCDWDASFVRKLGLHADFTSYKMGVRSQRFAVCLNDGIVQHVFVDEGGKVEATMASNVLRHIAD